MLRDAFALASLVQLCYPIGLLYRPLVHVFFVASLRKGFRMHLGHCSLRIFGQKLPHSLRYQNMCAPSPLLHTLTLDTRTVTHSHTYTDTTTLDPISQAGFSAGKRAGMGT